MEKVDKWVATSNKKDGYQIIYYREMLISALRALVKNPVKESFYGKRKKKTINVLTVFFISHKSDVKTFLK